MSRESTRPIRSENRFRRPEKRCSGLSSSERGVGAPIPTPRRWPVQRFSYSITACSNGFLSEWDESTRAYANSLGRERSTR
jgi:hypothetical protein